MITMKCKACNASMDSNFWSESLQEYNDLCYTCLEAIGCDSDVNPYSASSEASLLLEQADLLILDLEGGTGDVKTDPEAEV